jgi:hypothetical protein
MYKERFSDLIFRTNLKNSLIPVFLLFEHKSYFDPQIIIQLRSYIDLIEEDFLEEQSKELNK